MAKSTKRHVKKQDDKKSIHRGDINKDANKPAQDKKSEIKLPIDWK